jgi:WD40 repeat protein
MAADRLGEFLDAETLKSTRSPGLPIFSPDGRRFVLVENARDCAQVGDASTGEPAGPPMYRDGIIVAHEFSPDGKSVVTSGSGVVRAWDAATGEPVYSRLERSNFVTFGPDSRTTPRARGRRRVKASLSTLTQPWFHALNPGRRFTLTPLRFSPTIPPQSKTLPPIQQSSARGDRCIEPLWLPSLRARRRWRSG